MEPERWCKAADVLVFRENGGNGLELVRGETGRAEPLDADGARAWAEGPWPAPRGRWGAREAALAGAGFLRPAPAAPVAPAPHPADGAVPRVAGRQVRWYRESCDLVVLFHAGAMPRNNPLLVLGPYGARCWAGVAEGRTVGEMRAEALRVFGEDEVLPFLRRLARLGFVERVPAPEDAAGAPERVRKEFPAPEVQFRLAHAAVPWYCLWELLTACNLRCRVCYLPHFSGRGPAPEEAMEVARQIAETGIFYVCLLGGEPLLRPDLEAVVSRLRGAGIFAKVITNGMRLTAARAEALAAAGLNQVEVSFDGLSPETHEASRGSGSFARAAAAVRAAREAGIPRVGVVWTVHSANVREMPRLPAFLDALGVEECYLSRFRKTGLNGARAPFAPLPEGEYARVAERICGWEEERPGRTVVLLPGCSCGRTSVVVGDTGDVRLCSFSYRPVGNVHRAPLGEIWRSLERSLPPRGPLGICAPGEAKALVQLA